jgi:hypothetical protein
MTADHKADDPTVGFFRAQVVVNSELISKSFHVDVQFPITGQNQALLLKSRATLVSCVYHLDEIIQEEIPR